MTSRRTNTRSRRTVPQAKAEQVPVDETAEVVEGEIVEPGTAVELVDHAAYEPNFVVGEIEPPKANPKNYAKAAREASGKAPKKDKKQKRPQILTPYKATQIMNADRVERGLKPVNSPFMYIMLSKGKFPAGKSADGRWEITDIDAFYAWMINHNSTQQARANAHEAADAE
jgi:hypothetical protein